MSVERFSSPTGDILNISGINMPASSFRRCIFILDELLSCYDCFQFLAPVPLTAVVYHAEVKQPMDFSTLENSLYANKYNTYTDFCQDLSLIWSNAKLFHRPFDLIYQQAENLLRRFSCLEEFLAGGPKPFYLSTSSSDIDYLLSNPLPEELLDATTQDTSVVLEEEALEQKQQLQIVLPMYKEIDPQRKTNLYFVQALSEQDNNTKKLRGFSNVCQLFQLLNASFFKYMTSPPRRYNSPPLPRFYIAKNRTLLTEVRADPQGVLAVLCNVTIKPLTKDLSRLQATVVICEPMGKTHGFDESSMEDEYAFCPKAWSKLRVIQVVHNVNTTINADIDRNFFKKFYNTYKLSAKEPNDLKKVGSEEITQQFVQCILNPRTGDAPPLVSTTTARKNGESNYIKIKRESASGTSSAQPQPPPATTQMATAEPTMTPKKRRGRPPKLNKKRSTAITTTSTTTPTTNGSFQPIIYTSGSPAAAALTTTTFATAAPQPSSNATTIRLVLNKIRSSKGTNDKGDDAMEFDYQTTARTPPTAVTTSSQEDVDVPIPAAMSTRENEDDITPNSITEDVDVPSNLTVQIPIEVYDDTASSSLMDTNTTTSPTNTYNDTDDAAYYEPMTASQETRALLSPDTTTFSNIYGDDAVKSHWKKLIDYAEAKHVPIVNLKTYELEIAKHSAEGFFKRVYFLTSDPTKVVQTFRKMTITQRTTEVVTLLSMKGIPHMGQITEVLVKDRENGDYEVLGLAMHRYQKTLKYYAHPHSHHRLTAHQKMDLVQQMLTCMDTIHQMGLAHRDLSEVNFMVDVTREKLADGNLKANLILIDFGKSVFTKPHLIRQWWIEHAAGKEEYDGEIVPLTKQELEVWCQRLPWIRAKPDHGYRHYRSIQTLPRSRTDTQDLRWLVDPVAEDMYSTGTLIWKIFSETEPWYSILDTDLKGLRETVRDDYHIEKALGRQIQGVLSKELLLKMIKATPDQRSSAKEVMDWISIHQQALLEEWVVNAPVERKKRHAKRYDDEDDHHHAGPSSPSAPANGQSSNKKQRRQHHTITTTTTTTNTNTIPPLKLRF